MAMLLNKSNGASLSSATTAAKKSNNNSNKNTIGCKVDGRVLFNICNASVDICNIEAAKGTSVMNKVYSDKAKFDDSLLNWTRTLLTFKKYCNITMIIRGRY